MNDKKMTAMDLFGDGLPAAPYSRRLLDARTAAARRLRDEGMSRVEGNQASDWRAAYMLLADTFIRERLRGDVFAGEALRTHALDRGLSQPTHPNAWSGAAGGMIRKWLKAGVIENVGMKQATSEKSHAHFYRVYRKT